VLSTTLGREYDAWGQLIQGGSTAGYGFQGREWDSEVSLYYFRARYYNPNTSKWAGEDPIGFAGGNNLSAFLNNNPTRLTDPFGLCGSEAGGPNNPKFPAPTGPDGQPTPPPVRVPRAPDLTWKWNPNSQNPRGGTWGPKGWKGPNPPNGSWDDEDGHWDINDGEGGNVDHYDPKGKPLTPGQAHPGNRQQMDTVIGVLGTIGTGYLIYRGGRMLPSLLFPALWPTIPLNAAIP